MKLFLRIPMFSFTISLAACSGAERPEAAGWVASIDTVGDTVIVRTSAGAIWEDTMTLHPEVRIGVLEGPDHYMLGSVSSIAVSPDGDIYIYDSHATALRRYSPTGDYVMTLGREGGGPGEYESPDGGLAVLSDGRVVLRDPGNGRFTVFNAEGDFLDTWPMPGGGGFSTSGRLFTDAEDNMYTMVLLERDTRPWDWTYGLARFGPQGEELDTLTAPTWDYENHVVTGQAENNSSSTRVPFSPSTSWTFNPLGYMVGGVSTDYRVDLYRPGGSVLRLEKVWTPVAVVDDEAEERERRIRENFSRRFPGWRWNGPDIPATKPAFRSIFTGEAGEVWVQPFQTGYETMTVAEAREEERLSGNVQLRYSEPTAFDVFAPDGRFLGHVRAPRAFQTDPTPIFGRDMVWAVERDELDVATVVRYRLIPAESSS